MLLANATMAQQPIPAFSLTAGTDFNGVMTALGLEGGIYTANRRHSFMLTFGFDRLTNNDLIKYGRSEFVHPEVSMSEDSYPVGLKYAVKVADGGPVSLSAVVHPWYSINIDRVSGFYGARVVFWKRDIVAAEVLHDPFAGRMMLRFVFTTTFKKG
ncbi:hypothetical protein [Chitinophaga japonensis]|uniref:Uncharacterized protein n=1 Tax=Chitinophaga japonensis TaxID=104662 RepID=A0A562SY74_CHIJA|nr:hypothetical protein [Chitinophaga japonensis]TWI86315.1 hypothetical protein LX66_3569 [Chitinophaga japonensis]